MLEVKADPSGPNRRLEIGELARRAGLATSAVRFYESKGLVTSERTASGHRRYRPDALRRLAFIKVAQQVGLSLGEIEAALATLPDQRTPTRADWTVLSEQWRDALDQRIALLVRLRDRLDGCIGCGCLSIDTCELHNADDRLGRLGPGPRYLLEDDPDDF